MCVKLLSTRQQQTQPEDPVIEIITKFSILAFQTITGLRVEPSRIWRYDMAKNAIFSTNQGSLISAGLNVTLGTGAHHER